MGVLFCFLFGLCSIATQPADDTAYVSSVTDGDTIRVVYTGRESEGTFPIRLIGINAPEYNVYQRRGECGGERATRALTDITLGSIVRLEYDHDRTDHYRRTLAYVYVGSTMVNVELARLGLARPYPIRPNTRYRDRIQAAWGDRHGFTC